MEREQRERAEKDQTERERAEKERERESVNAKPYAVQTALSALTTIIMGSEPSQLQQQSTEGSASSTKRPLTHASVNVQRPIIVDEITTTTNSIKEIYNVQEHQVDEIIHQHSHHESNTGELNNEISETDYINNIPDVTKDEIDLSQMTESDKARLEFAGNYANSLVYNIYNTLSETSEKINSTINTDVENEKVIKRDDEKKELGYDLYTYNNMNSFHNTSISLTPLPLCDELKHLIDERFDNQNYSHSFVDQYDIDYVEKTFTFTKNISEEELKNLKQPSLSQVLKSIVRMEKYDSEFDTISASYSEEKQVFAPAYSLGIRLLSKENRKEIGNHIISQVEPHSLADLAGIKVNSKLIRINDVFLEDKTHEFVLFYLNYLLRKNSCTTIEITLFEQCVLDKSKEIKHVENTHLKKILNEIRNRDEDYLTYEPTTISSSHFSKVTTQINSNNNINTSYLSYSNVNENIKENISNLKDIINQAQSSEKLKDSNEYIINKNQIGFVDMNHTYVVSNNNSSSTYVNDNSQNNKYPALNGSIENLKSIIMEIKNQNQQQFALNPINIQISNIDTLTQREFEIANQTVNQFENTVIIDNNLTPEQIYQLTLEKGICS